MMYVVGYLSYIYLHVQKYYIIEDLGKHRINIAPSKVQHLLYIRSQTLLSQYNVLNVCHLNHLLI